MSHSQGSEGVPEKRSRLSGMKLTAKQQAAWDLKQAGRSNIEGAAALGVSVNVYAKTLVVVRKKLGLTGKLMNGVEHKNPELAAKVLDALSDPRFETLAEACRAAEVPDRVARSLINRLKYKFYAVGFEARNLQKKELSELLGKRIHLGLHYLDDKAFSEASARDIMMGVSQLIEKQQLIEGLPTAIVSDLERKKLNELAPALMAEIQRRGLTIPGEVVERTIETA